MNTIINRGKRKYIMKTICYVLQFTILLTSFVYGYSIAYNTNTIGIKNFKVTEKDNFNVQGTFTLTNNSGDVFPELWYSTQLFCSFEPGKSNLINSDYIPVSLTKVESKIITFNHVVPAGIPYTDYNLVLRIYDRTGAILAIAFSSLGKLGEGSDYLRLFIEKTSFPDQTVNKDPMSGPTYKQGDKPVLRTTIKNISSTQKNAYIRIATYRRNITFESKPISTIVSEKLFTFGANQEKIVDINLPTFSFPESYYFNLDFVDADDNKISGIMEARYVLGGISAKIIGDTADYKDGKLTIEQTIAGSADRTPIINATSRIEVYDDANNLLFSDEKVIPTLNSSASVSYEKVIPIDNSTIEIKHTIKSGSTLLDSLTQTYQLKDISEQPTGTSPPPTIVTPRPDATRDPSITQKPRPTADPDQEFFLTDIAGTDFEESVRYLVQGGIIRGYGDNTYRPYNNITRAEFVSIIMKLINKGSEVDKSSVRNNFSDVSMKHWAYGSVNKAFEQNILKGYPDGTFKPDAPVTFAEAITVCVNIVNVGENKRTLAKWPESFVKEATRLGIDEGLNYSPSAPKGAANRGEIAKLVYNLVVFMG